MPRVPFTTLLALSRRGYAASAGAEVQKRAPAMAGRVSGAEGGAGQASSGGDIFWMRDPKTGNWIPENRFADIDAAELRAQLLSRKA
ncbi:protein SENESCENCE-ASSOCIATED GENE 21, mitochondrial [Lolium perenne]|uniref:protein SENESCENCE-ASSOCIATED GENE 21, mitochondrial n=1 Tax=Lolium perenne TaxID=4522 RepID=UPI0021E9FAAB|nr:protein SENESCENCE-ASSOCIATED GENE 21, mitochondrial-like [Lolium perenne]